jgi:hypothetical protein
MRNRGGHTAALTFTFTSDSEHNEAIREMLREHVP